MKYEPFKTDFDPQPQQEQEDPNLLFDLFAAPFRGLEGLGRGVYSLADFVSFDVLPDLDEERLLGSSKTIAGGLVEGVTQFIVPFGGIAKGLSLAGKAGKASKLLAKGKTGGNITDLNWKGYLAASTVTDAVAFDGQEARLSNLIQQFPQLQNPVTEFLAADPDDNQAIGRAKNVLEGLLLEAGNAGLVVPFVKALGAVKARKLAKSKGATLVEEEEVVAKALGDGSELQIVKETDTEDVVAKPDVDGAIDTRPDPVPEVPQSALDDIAVVKTASGGQAIRQASAGKMTVKDAQGNEIQQNTIDGGLSTDELSQVLEAGTKKLTAQSQQVGSEAQERIMYEEVADATGLSTKGIEGIVAQAGKDKTTLARINGRMRALRSYMVGNGLDIVELAKAYKGLKEAGIDDDVIAAKIKSKFELQLHLQANVANLASGFGRGLQSLQQKVGKIGISAQEIANKKLRQDYLRKRGGVDVDKIVNDILLATDGQPSDIGTLIGLNKIVRGSEGGKWTNMVREYYINSLLSGPRTWSVNLLGNFLTATLLQFERYVGGWMSADQNTRKAVAWTFSQLFGVREAWEIAGKVAKLQENLLDIGHGSFKEQQDITGSITGKNLLGEQLSKEKDGLAQAIDKVGDVVRIPSRILMSTDELFKQVLYRQRAAAQLFLQAADRGITDPKQISEYIHDSIQSMVTASGRHFSEGSLIKDAQELAKGQDFEDHVARENFIADEVSKARARHMELAREKGLVDAEDDYGALQQFSEQWIEPNLDFARTGTFTNDLGPVSSKFNQFIQAVPLGWLVVPFVRTPTNILKFAFDRVMAAPRAVTEVGINKFSSLEGLRTDFLDQLKSADPLVRAEARGKLATSAMLNGVLMTTMFMNKDWITGGGPLNTREKRLWEAAGNRPYSIKDPITGNWVSYQRLDPFATILGVYADLAHVQNDSVHGYDKTEMERVVAAMAVTLARNVTNKSYLAGIHKVVEALSDPETKATDMLNSLAAGAVPNILYHGQSISGDQELKETRNLADSLLRKLPGGSERVDPRRNILGEAYVAEQIETMPFNLLNPFNPISWSSKNGDPILTELANLHHGFSPPSHKLNSLVDLTEHTASNGHSAYDRWLELQSEVTVNGRTLRDTLEKLINSKSYRSLDPRSEIGLKSPRVTLINRVLGTYRRKALMEMLKEFPQVDHLYKQSQRAKAQYRSGTTDQETVLQLLQ